MSLSALQEYIRIAKYAQYRPDQKRRETWTEQVDRIIDQHARFFQSDAVNAYLEEVKPLLLRKEIVGSQRVLQFGGDPVLKHHLRSYNCSGVLIEYPRVFQEIFYVLLCGTGCGYSVQRHHVDRLPPVKKPLGEDFYYMIPDSIEGWADAIGHLVSSYFTHDQPFLEVAGRHVIFDYSLIRPEGAALSSGAKAPGPKGLARTLESIRAILDRVAETSGKLEPIDAHDIICFTADSVISGGVRRSALISIFSFEDEAMMNCKTGPWFQTQAQRARANNSAALVRGKVSWESFCRLMKSTKEFGEPAFIWVSDNETIVNPCFHPDTLIATSKGYKRIEDMYRDQCNEVVVDSRIRDGYEVKGLYGTKIHKATQVELTQRQAQTYILKTTHGQSVCTTANHMFPTTKGRKSLAELIPGDELYLPSGEFGQAFGTTGTYDQGLLVGMFVGDGTTANKDKAFIDLWGEDCEFAPEILAKLNSWVSTNQSDLLAIKQTSFIPKLRMGGKRFFSAIQDLGLNPFLLKRGEESQLLNTSKEFIKGYLAGLIFTDGSVQSAGHGKKNTVSIRLSQINVALLNQVSLLLGMFGIISRTYLRKTAGQSLLPDGNGGSQFYPTQSVYEIILSRPNAINFAEKIGLYGRKKNLLRKYLDLRGPSLRKPERFITRVLSIEEGPVTDVYCLNEPATHSVIANGIVTGQCSEISWNLRLDDKTPPWGLCNLSDINGARIKTREDFLRTCRGAAIIGTLQAAYTNVPYLGQEAMRLVEKERLLGVSITGIQDAPDILSNAEILREGAAIVRRTNEEVAAVLGIPAAARTTCVKPSGTASALLGTASGIHPHHSRRYLRRVQANRNEAPFNYYKTWNPRAVERSVWDQNGVTQVISFPCEVPKGSRLKNQMSALDLLENVRFIYQNWVVPGTREDLCHAKGTTHNVSNTITVKEDEWDDVTRYIYDHQDELCGVSLLPESGDKDYAQAPFCAVPYPREIYERYGPGSFFAGGLIQAGENCFDTLWQACDALLYRIPPKDAAQEEWFRRAEKFSIKYFNANHKQMTWCLKDVYNLKTWEDLVAENLDVDWEGMYEDRDNVNFTGESACAGGACSIL